VNLVIGVDPDLNDTGIAMCSEEKIHGVWVIHSGSDWSQDRAVEQMARAIADFQCPLDWMMTNTVVIEQPTIYPKGKTRRPMDILRLAQVASMMALKFTQLGKKVHMRPPSTTDASEGWKGQIKKYAHQHEVLLRYNVPGLPHKDGYIPACGRYDLGGQAASLVDDQWIHVVDAIGLARYGAHGMRSLNKERRKPV
jgi:hypothetical protein